MKSKKTLALLTAVMLASVSLSGCNGGTKNAVTGVSFERSSYVVNLGDEVTLRPTVTGTGTFDSTVVWTLPTSDFFTVETLEEGAAVLVTATDETEDDEVWGSSIDVVATSAQDSTISATVKVSILKASNGYVDYTDQKEEVLAALEKYAAETHLSGITFMGNGGYVMYANGIEKGSNSFIPGYGFGVLAEGRITQPLTGSGVTPAYNMYYHTFQSSDPKKLNYMDDEGSQVSDLMSYTAASYWDTQMNETKDGYDWVADLAKVNRPIPVDENFETTGVSATYKFPVKVGSELKYSTNSTIARFAAFNNREVALEDYVTPYKIYYTKAYGLARSAENIKPSDAGSLVGTQAYYNNSGDGFNAEKWNDVGIKAYVDENDGESYLEFTFNSACTPFYAMYYLASSMFQPVPEEFVLACGGAGNESLLNGVKAWGVSSSDNTESPADHWLSTGPYTIEKWNIDQNIVYKKNTNYADRGRYQIEGVHINILAAAQSDDEAGFREFLAGNLSACGIPTKQLKDYRNDPRTTQTASSSNFKLNVNTCDENTWEYLFGEHGVIDQNAKSDYWAVEPAMHIKEFVDGISYSINRKEFAETVGRTPAHEFFADTYLIDPENGISYNSTDAHQAALAEIVEGTDGNGYSLELARQSFLVASEQLIENGDYNVGNTIEVEIAWQEQSDAEAYGGPIKKYIEDAFNFEENPLKLSITNWYGAEWSDVYYKKMLIGKYDLGFGSISGNSYDPLNFFDTLMTDGSTNFCLNWGTDVNAVDGNLVYNDEAWSFKALWAAGDHGVLVENGAIVDLVAVLDLEVERLADGSLVFRITVDEKHFDDDNYGMLTGVCLYAATDSSYSDYDELYVTMADTDHFVFDEQAGCYVITFAADLVAAWLESFPPAQLYTQGLDLHVVEVLNGNLFSPAGASYYSIDEAGTIGTYLGTYWSNLIPEIPAP